MTRVTCDAYVPPGFNDSGWEHYACYVEDEINVQQATRVLRGIMDSTEITKCHDVKVCPVAAIPKGGHVVDLAGGYVRMEGWL